MNDTTSSAPVPPACLKAAVFLGGLAGLAGQMLLLRELLVVFTGNELTIGVILANWLLLEAFGCRVLGRRADAIRNLPLAYAVMNWALPCGLIGMVFATRLIRPVLGYAVGQPVGILPVVFSSALVLLPVSTLHGALFTFAGKLYATRVDGSNAAGALSTIYIHETLGTLGGGLLWTFLFSSRLQSFAVAGTLLALHALAAMLALWPVRHGGAAPRRGPRGAAWAGLCWVLALVLLAQSRGLEGLHHRSLRRQWAPQEVILHQNSRYGNATAVEQDGEYTIFLDGLPYLSLPTPPDIAWIEEFVHLPMLIHREPRSLLVLGGGAGGVLEEILKHAVVRQVAYAELDPMLLELLDRLPAAAARRELADPRVRVVLTDGRLLLQRSPVRYDILWVGLTGLNDLQGNRFFTREFFSLAASRLREDGLLVFALPGSISLSEPALQGLNAMVYHTVRTAFPHVRVFPGEGHNLFVASRSEAVEAFSKDAFLEAVAARGLEVEQAIPRHLAGKLHPGWRGWFEDFIAGARHEQNRDFHPRGLLHGLSHWNLATAPVFSRVFGRAATWGGRQALPVFLLLLGGFILLRRGCRRMGSTDVPLCVATSGFAGMSYDLVLIFAFQALYGVVIGWIGLLVSVFMAGAACGATLLSRKALRSRHCMRLLLRLDLLVALFSLLLPLALLLLKNVLPGMGPGMLAAFLALSFCSGAVISMQFPVAAALRMPGPSGGFGAAAGALYAADLVGGWLAGLAVAVLILPAYGLVGVGLWVAGLKCFSMISLAIRLKGPYHENHGFFDAQTQAGADAGGVPHGGRDGPGVRPAKPPAPGAGAAAPRGRDAGRGGFRRP